MKKLVGTFVLVVFFLLKSTSALWGQMSVALQSGINCANNTISTYYVQGGTCATYTWSVTGGTKGTNYNYNITSNSTFQVSWLTAGTYTVRCTCSSGTISPLSVPVTSPPTVYTVSSPGAPPYCSGNAITISLSNSQSGVSYSLYPGNVVRSGTTGSSLQWTGQTAAGTYTVTATASNGCWSDMSGSVVINPNLTSAVLSGNATICPGASTNLSVAISGGTGPYSFTINGYGSVTNYTSGSPIAVSPSSSTNYTLGTVTDSKGCTVAGSGGANVTVNPAVASAVLNPSTATTCAGQSTNLSVTISGGTPPYSFTISGYGAVTNYTSGSSIPVNPSSNITYTLGTVTDSKGCSVAGTGSSVVTVNPGPTSAILKPAGTTSVCAGQGTSLKVDITGGTGPYSFSIDNYGPVTNYTSGTAIAVSPASTTNYTIGSVTDSKGCPVTGTGNVNITVIPLPSSISGIQGLTTNFTGEPSLVSVTSGPVVTSFGWSGGTIADASGTVPGQKVLLKVGTSGANTIAVTPVNNGCQGTPYNFTFTGLSASLANTSLVTLPHGSLTGLPVTYFDLPKHNPSNPPGCISQLSDVTVNMAFDMGDNYNLGANVFSTVMSATITAYSDLPGVQQSWDVSFSLNQNTPEQLFKKVIAVNPELVRFIKVQVNTYSNTTLAAQNLVRLRMWLEEKDFVNAANVTVSLNGLTPTSDWEQTFTWNSNCPDVTDYVFQLLRLYGSESIDWNKALTIETESSATSLTVSMAEGSGNYVWRVIPIGNLPEGISNPLNWGTPSASSSFTYNHVEDGKNWIYSRTFTEGNRISEQVTYANGLQQVAQQETRIQGINQVVASQTLQDFAGRNALVSLPVPTGLQKLGYIGSLLKKSDGSAFTVNDFDTDATLRVPNVTGDYSGYYGGSDVSLDGGATFFNSGVASAQGYPYSRTLFGPDGRVQEQAGVGLAHSVAGGKTVKTYYSNPTVGELVRLFGSEAPDVKSVQKVTTFDANNTASISYKTKDGKVIATALEVGSSTGALNALPSAASSTISLYEEVSGYEKINNSTISSRKPLFFAKPTSVALDYQITPTLLKELCASGSNQNLVGYYPFDSNTLDESVSKNNGSVLGTGVTFTTDAFGVAGMATNIVATGTTYIQLPDAPANDFGTGDFTVSFWVKKNVTSTNGTNCAAVTKWNSTAGTNEWAFQIGHSGPDNNIPHFAIESGTTTYDVSATSALALGTWYNLVAVRSGAQLSIYVNGLQQGSLTLPAGTAVNNVGRSILLARNGAGNYTNAAFDELQIYNRALSSSEILALQKRGTVCKTCDYKIDLLLYKEGVDAPQSLLSQIIQAGNCTDQTSLAWDPVSQNVSFDPAVKYTLEKRITLLNTDASGNTYLSNHLTEVENKYRTQISGNTFVSAINTYLANNNMTGLKTYLTTNFQYDTDNKFFIVPLGSGGGCADFLYVPDYDLCPVTPTYSESDCKRSAGSLNQSFSEYFISYYTGNTNVKLYDTNDRNGDGQLNDQAFLFFNNLYTNLPVYFSQSGNTVSEFDQMVVNMKADNGLTCAQLWAVWENQVAAYEAISKIDLGSGNTANMGTEAINYLKDLTDFSTVKGQTYNLYESFVKAVEGSLQQNMSGTDICVNRTSSTYPYFIMNTQLYGYFRQTAGGAPTSVSPDLSHAYRLCYYNETVSQQIKELKFYAGYTNPQIEDGTLFPSKTDFDALQACDKHKFALNTQMGSVSLSDADIQSAILKVRNKCNQVCQSRSGEFRAKVIQSIMSQNPATLIEHYNTYQDPYRTADADPSTPSVIDPFWVGVRDVTRNVTGFTFSECELDALVDALVQNCGTYCNATLTPQDKVLNGKTYRVFGTDDEQLKIKQVLSYDFDVSVLPNGTTSCQNGYDFIPERISSIGVQPWEYTNQLIRDFRSWSSNGCWVSSMYDYRIELTPNNEFYIEGLLYEGSDYARYLANGTNLIVNDDDGDANWIADNFTAKFDLAGNFLWNNQYARSLTSSSIGFTNQAGTAGGRVSIHFFKRQLGPYSIKSGNTTLLSASNNGFVVKQSSTGSVEWIKGINAPFPAYDGYGIRNQVISDGAGYVTFQEGTSDRASVQLIKLDANGNTLWQGNSITFKYAANEAICSLDPSNNNGWSSCYPECYPKDISVPYRDSQGNFYYSATFSTNYGNLVLKNNGVSLETFSTPSSLILKFDQSGNYLWHKIIKGMDRSPYIFMPSASNSLVMVWQTYTTDVQKTINGYALPGYYNKQISFYGLELGLDGSIIRGNSIVLPAQGSYPITDFYSDSHYIYFSHYFQNSRNLPYVGKVDWSQNSILTYPITLPTNIAFSTGTIPKILGVSGDDLYLGLGQFGTPNRAMTIGKFHTNAGQCHRMALCFKFTTPRNTTLVIPPDMANNVYDPQEIPCNQLRSAYVSNAINNQIEQIINNRKQAFSDRYFQQCGDMSLIQDKLTLTYNTGLHHFTLYYYDRAGNLIRTVPPEGVQPLAVNTASALATAQATLPQHQMVTEYQYNSLGQLRWQHSPDGTPRPNNLTDRPAGTLTDTQLDDADYYSSFIYSSKSLLRFSRNAKQKADAVNLPYSYTKYDVLGRVIEVGEATGYDYNTLYASRDALGANSFPVANTRQVTTTVYTATYPGTLPPGYAQDAKTLNNRVSYTTMDEDLSTSGNEVITVYNYDEHGNVKWLVQSLPGMDPRVIEYEYDLISGKVNRVKYNPGQTDQFFHKYDYDANNRLTTVYTSRDCQLWQRDARYEYYLHGPLRRTLLGEDEVQGIDYTYTIHGWLKAINHAYLDMTSDPKQDASGTSQTARDAFGMALGYYTGDYLHTGSTLDAAHASTLNPLAGRDLYNSNIGSWTTNAAGWKALPQMNHQYLTGQQFTYDELNRIVASNFLTGTAYTASTDYNTTYSYSANGNITAANIKGFGGAVVDNLTYTYPTYNSKPLSNLLQQVTESAAATSFADDVEAGQTATNYQYDAIGNLVRDVQQNTLISWTPYGKVKMVQKTDASGTPTGEKTEFTYDASGNRVIKKYTSLTGLVKTQFYVRDASGNIMAVYEKLQQPAGSPELAVTEMPIYGSDRLGRYTGYINLSGAIEPLGAGEVRIASDAGKNAYEGLGYLLNAGVQLTLQPGFTFTASAAGSFVVRVAEGSALSTQPGLSTRKLLERQYELKDHLGNVRVVVSDLKNSTLTANAPGTYEPDLLNINHYYPFGMDQPGRTWSDAGKYRYGFNGQEKDDNGEFGEDHYAFRYRIYNPSIGRFLTLDPLESRYPHNSPYAFAENKLGLGRELEGLELFYFDPGLAPAYHYTYGRGDGNIGFGDFAGGIGMAFLENFTPYGTSRRTVNAMGNYVRNEIDHSLNGGISYQKATAGGYNPYNVTTNYEFNKFKSKIELVSAGMEWWALAAGGAEGALTEVSLLSPSGRMLLYQSSSSKGISLGLKNGKQLSTFAAKFDNAPYMDQWLANGLRAADAPSFDVAFHQATNKVISSGGRINFDLTGFDITKAMNARGKGLYDKGVGYTDWEFNQIIGNKNYLKHTDFYENGVKKSTENVLERAGIKK